MNIDEQVQECRVEAVARFFFENSMAGQMECWHWPGDEPKFISNLLHVDEEMWSLPADHPDAPQQGKAPEKLREFAKKVFEVADGRFGK